MSAMGSFSEKLSLFDWGNLNILDDPMCLIDKDGLILSVNRAFRENIFSIDFDGFIKRPYSFPNDFIHVEDRKNIIMAIQLITTLAVVPNSREAAGVCRTLLSSNECNFLTNSNGIIFIFS